MYFHVFIKSDRRTYGGVGRNNHVLDVWWHVTGPNLLGWVRKCRWLTKFFIHLHNFFSHLIFSKILKISVLEILIICAPHTHASILHSWESTISRNAFVKSALGIIDKDPDTKHKTVASFPVMTISRNTKPSTKKGQVTKQKTDTRECEKEWSPSREKGEEMFE